MSLNERCGMLGFDDLDASRRKAGPGANPGVFGCKRGSRV